MSHQPDAPQSDCPPTLPTAPRTATAAALGAPVAPRLHLGRPLCRALLHQAVCGLAPTADPAWPAQSASREVWLIDPGFADWPLDDAAVLAALTAWLRQPARRLRLLGCDFQTTERCHPKFARWRRDWAHAIEAWRPAEGGLQPGLRGLWAAGVGLLWLDAPDWRMRCVTDVVHLRAAQAQIADFLQRCEPAWPPTTLGL